MLCIRCGTHNPKGPCERKDCPFRLLYANVKKVHIEGKESFSGKSPNIFVGKSGYPHVFAGVLSAEHVDDDHDNPKRWAKEGYSIQSIVGLRSSLINSRFKTSVRSFSDRLSSVTKEVAMAKAPVDMDISLDRKPHFTLSLSEDVAPFGPSVGLKSAKITENVKVLPAVEKAVGADDLRATSAITELYRKNVDEHSLTKLLSAGTLGVKTERKLVPTRWSITAVDDTLGKSMIAKVKEYPVHEYAVLSGSFLGNYYFVFLFPEVWGYELFESYVMSNAVMTDHEGYAGRKDYASETVGGYYAARLALLEYLSREKRQASCLMLRFITDEYTVPLGVWVVRTAARNSFAEKGQRFTSAGEMIDYGKKMIMQRFGRDITPLLSRSVLLRERRIQKRLDAF